MTRRSLLIALLLVTPIAVAGQTPPPAGPPAALKTPFAAMQANLNRVPNAAERERWEANVTLWSVKMKKNQLDADDIDIMKKAFGAMKANVAKVTDAAEKERWDANIAMWEVLMAAPGKVAKAGRDQMLKSLDVIKANLAKIRVAAERERWDANREMWTVTLRLM